MGPEYAFEVRPPALAAYAESLRAGAADLAAVGQAVAAVRVEREWFGRLPQAGFLADRYASHREGVLAHIEGVSAWLRAAALGLAESADRYSAADRVVAGSAEDVRAALRIGIEIPGPATGHGETPTADEARE